MVERVYQYLPHDLDRDYVGTVEVIPLNFLPHALNAPPQSVSTLLHLRQKPFELSECIEMCREVLSRISKDDAPRVWADFQRWLAEGLLCSTYETRSRNIEETLKCIIESQTFYYAAEFPHDYAELEIIAGTALSALLEDEIPLYKISDKLIAADNHFKRAISLLSPEKTPKLWAQAHVRRGALLLAIAEFSR